MLWQLLWTMCLIVTITLAYKHIWIKLASLLNRIFFKNIVFTAESHNGRPFGLQFLKFAARVLKKFPATQSYPEDLTLALVSN